MVSDTRNRARSGQTGQWIDSADGQHWWFDSGSIALDFAYTGALGDGPSVETLLAPDDLSEWLNARYSPAADAAAEVAGTAGPRIQTQDRDLIDALALRGAIARLATAAAAETEPDGQDIDIVNLFAATPDIPPALLGGSRQAGRTSPRAGQALATLARTAVDLFGPDTEGRIRYCSADDCGVLYLDTSRSANRRWCSMQRCGNRAKVRAFRERSSATAQPPASTTAQAPVRTTARHAMDSPAGYSH